MAMIKKGTQVSVTSLVHRCGAMLAVVNRDGAISYQDGNEHIITVCPYCLQEIEWGDLQDPDMVSEVGWPNN